MRHTSRQAAWPFALLVVVVGVAAGACSGSAASGLGPLEADGGSIDGAPAGSGAGGDPGADGEGHGADGRDASAGDAAARDATAGDAQADGSVQDATADTGGNADGPPTRVACTNKLGQALSAVHGRLDGILVSVVQPASGGSCNADPDHLHLQVRVAGSVYDVAVTIRSNQPGDELFLAKDAPLPSAWSEGWHPEDALDYTAAPLAVHATDFASMTPADLVKRLDAELATANHVAIYATGYGPDGAHLVHRLGLGVDGAIVVDPLGPTPHYLLLHFLDQAF